MNKISLAMIIMGMSASLIGCSNQVSKNNVDINNNKITVEQAKEIALKHSNLTDEQVSFIRTETDFDNGLETYNIEFYHENKEYDYEINAADGQIIEYDYDVESYNITNQTTNNNANTSEITEEEAKESALKHANLSSDQVTFVKTKMDVDNGVKKYDVEFYYENKEYDYEIDASNGQVISYDYDTDYYDINQGSKNNNTVNQQTVNNSPANITEDQAKNIALEHANLNSRQVTFVRSEMDFDDGVQSYDIEFYHNNMEYNYEIDASTGNIIGFEQE